MYVHIYEKNDVILNSLNLLLILFFAAMSLQRLINKVLVGVPFVCCSTYINAVSKAFNPSACEILEDALKTIRKYVIVLCSFVLFVRIMSGSDNAAHFLKRRLKRSVA
jgi:ABC-type iron transport system FetAB permease component